MKIEIGKQEQNVIIIKSEGNYNDISKIGKIKEIKSKKDRQPNLLVRLFELLSIIRSLN